MLDNIYDNFYSFRNIFTFFDAFLLDVTSTSDSFLTLECFLLSLRVCWSSVSLSVAFRAAPLRASFTELDSFSLGWEGRLWLRENIGEASRSFTEGRAVLVALEERMERRTFSKVQTKID